jgi:hypothetical protein
VAAAKEALERGFLGRIHEYTPTNGSNAPSANRPSWPQTLMVLAVFAALATRLLALISQYAVNVFFMDQWDFNKATLFEPHSLWQMFRWQHGPHRQGLGAVLAYLIEPHFGWNSRSESFLVGGIVILAAACALWLKKRLFGSLTLFDVGIPLILLNTLQYETLFITSNLAHGPLPLLLVLLYCISWTVSRAWLRYSLVLLVNFLALYTGFGFFLGLITPLALALDYWLSLRHLPAGQLYFLLSLGISLLSLGSFFIGYRLETSVDCSPNVFQSPVTFLHFLVLMFANLLAVKGIGILPVLVGSLLLAAIVAALLFAVRAMVRAGEKSFHSPRWTAAICTAYCLLFSANAAYARSCLGVQVAQVSRYAIYMELGALGLYFSLLLIPRPYPRIAALLVLIAVLAASTPVRRQDRQVMEFCKHAKLYWSACYLSVEDIGECNRAVGYGVYPLVTPELKSKLDYLKQRKQNLYLAAH